MTTMTASTTATTMTISSTATEVKLDPKTDDALLLAAILRGSIEEVKNMLDNGMDINAPSILGPDPLYMAAFANDLPKCKLFVDHGANPSTPWKGMPFGAFSVALHMADRDVIDYFLSLGADVNARDDKGLTPLMLAAINGEYSTATNLMALGCDHMLTSPEGLNAQQLGNAAVQTATKTTVRKLQRTADYLNSFFGRDAALKAIAASTQNAFACVKVKALD